MSTDLERRNPAQELVARVRSDDFRQQVAAALPPTVTPDRFVRVAATAVMTNPELARLDPNSVLRAMVQCATVGLMPDGVEAAITKRGDGAQFMPMISGFRKIAAEHGWLLRTGVAYTKDTFDYTDEPPAVWHRSVRPGTDRGTLIAAYAIATHNDGRRLQVVLHPEEVAARKAMATTQNVWQKWPASMWEKSAGRALFKKLPLAETDSERRRIERLLEASVTEDPVAALYGARRELPAQSSATASEPNLPGSDAHIPEADAAQPQPATPAAEAAPVPGVDEEPVIDGEATDAEDGDIAAQAASFVIPNGKNRGKTLRQVLDAGDDGLGWIRWALRNIGWPSPENESEELYRDAIWAFAAHFATDVYREIRAEKEAAV